MAKKSTAIDVTHGVIWQQLLSLCVPIFFSSFFQQAYTLIGTYIVGQFGGKLALGGIQATMVLTELCIGFCVGVGAGCAVITGQFFGQHDDERLSRSVHTAMTLALVGGIVISILGMVFVEPMLVLMNTPHELLAEGVAYARCYFAAMFAALLLNMGTALLRAVGDTRGPAVIIASGCFVNVALDILFVAVLHLEALGCGIAVALTICTNATMIVIRMMRAPGAWRLSLSKLGIDRGICKSMLSCGLPLGVQSAAYSISNVLIQVSVNSFGADVTTAWGLSGRLDGIIWMVTEALGVSITTFSAQNFGARNYDRMRKGYHTSLVLVYAHWWPVCRAAGVLGSVVAFVHRRCRDIGLHHDDSSFHRAVLRDLLDYRKRVRLHPRRWRELPAYDAHDLRHGRAPRGVGVRDYAARPLARASAAGLPRNLGNNCHDVHRLPSQRQLARPRHCLAIGDVRNG